MLVPVTLALVTLIGACAHRIPMVRARSCGISLYYSSRVVSKLNSFCIITVLPAGRELT